MRCVLTAVESGDVARAGNMENAVEEKSDGGLPVLLGVVPVCSTRRPGELRLLTSGNSSYGTANGGAPNCRSTEALKAAAASVQFCAQEVCDTYLQVGNVTGALAWSKRLASLFNEHNSSLSTHKDAQGVLCRKCGLGLFGSSATASALGRASP